VSPLSGQSRQRAMRLSLLEGGFFAFMVGSGESYLIANAVRLGASPLELGLIVSLPLCLGALGPFATLAVLSKLEGRKPWTVAAALAQALVLLAISLLDIAGLLVIQVLIAAACLSQMAGMAAGSAWSSWYGDLVPQRLRGRYFSRRNRVVQLATFAGLISSGLLLHHLHPEAAVDPTSSSGVGFQLIFGIAAASRLVSALILAVSPEPDFHGLSRPDQFRRFLGTSRGQNAWRLLAAGSALQLATYVASPYFGPFMLQELRFTYGEYMIATLAVVAGKFLMLPSWGRSIDRHGARPVYLLVVLLVALVPLPWLWARDLWWVIPAQLFSGVSWSGFEVSFFSVLLHSSFKRTRVYIFAAQNALNGTCQLLGGLLGGLILTAAPGQFRWIFGTSVLLRQRVALRMPGVLPRGTDDQLSRRELALRIVGFRPSGGIVHRPIIEGGDESDVAPPGRSG
jgi:MFS family permease